ncbi:MAG TPA: hypothetical protein VF406_05015 [Thermodesulfobacteriota bacterium]
MTTDTSRRVLRVVAPAFGVDVEVRYAEILGERLDALAARVRERAGGAVPAGAKLRFTYADHHGKTTVAWPTDSVEWLMKRTPELTATVADPADPMAV